VIIAKVVFGLSNPIETRWSPKRTLLEMKMNRERPGYEDGRRELR